jgi:hypothetical protein
LFQEHYIEPEEARIILNNYISGNIRCSVVVPFVDCG